MSKPSKLSSLSLPKLSKMDKYIKQPQSPFVAASPITPDSPIHTQYNTCYEKINGIKTRQSTKLNDENELNDIERHNVEIHTRSSTIYDELKSYSGSNEIDDIESKIDKLYIDANDTAIMFKKRGYQIIGKIQDTLQGYLYKAIRNKDKKMVAIKATSKLLHKSRTSQQEDGMSIVVEENIILESIILHHLTVVNTNFEKCIVPFLDFFETEHNYYLITEYVSDVTLRDFTNKCHQYIESGKLRLKEYSRIKKFLFWQICCCIHWMHEDIGCVHLDLNMDNIMVKNAAFITNTDGSISINPKINIVLLDFGLAEIFKNGNFICSKHGMTENQTYDAPKMYNGYVYDARLSDMWSLGIIFYTMCIGIEPYKYPNSKIDDGYNALEHGDLVQYLEMNGCRKYVNNSSLRLITGLLNIDDKQRLNAKQVLESNYLTPYMRKYRNKINEKSQLQKVMNSMQREQMKEFPFYKMNR